MSRTEPYARTIPHPLFERMIINDANTPDEAPWKPERQHEYGYFPGCVDFMDVEVKFSHLNKGDADHASIAAAAIKLMNAAGIDPLILDMNSFKCCGHDQKWQGMEEVFEKLKAYNKQKLEASGIDTLVSSCAECFRTFAMDYDLEGIKVMHTTEYLIENGFDMDLAVDDEMTVTFHDPCRLGRQMNIYDGPRDLIEGVKGVNLVEMEHTKEDAMCCGVSSMMSCNEDSRTIRVQRFEEVRATGAEIMLTSCPKCVSHFECLKFEGDPRHDFEILDVVSFLARQVDAKKERATNVTEVWQQPTTDEVEA